MSEVISAAELTYLELTAKHSPAELPATAPLVARLVDELQAREPDTSEVEALAAQVSDLQDRITELELTHKREESKWAEEKKELQNEIEELQEQISDADDLCELC